MRRIVKTETSEIISQNLKYIEGNSTNNKKISEVLFKEQKGFCAYTEEFIGRADARDIEHFNPNLKGSIEDNYNNWFLVKHQWNKEKSKKWDKFQPILYPTDETFESRIIYDNGDYIVSNSEDTEAKYLLELLNLSDAMLADERKKYIRRKKEEIEKFGQSASDFFEILIEADIKQISYIRAIQSEFELNNIWDMIPQPQ